MRTALLVKTWRDHWRGFLAWCLGLAAMAAVQLSVYPSIQGSSDEMDAMLKNWPDLFQGMFSFEDYTTGPGFLNVELFSMMVPLVFIALAVSWGASATADEERNGTADVLLTLPVSRTSVIVTKMLAMVGALLALGLVVATVIAIGGPWVEISIPFLTLLGACLASALLGLLFGAIAFLLGAATGKRAVAMGVAIGLALASFLVKSLSAMVDTFDAINPYNPFQWALQRNPLVDPLQGSSAAWLTLLSLAVLTAAVLAFRRRDIPA
jgi:ABC-2 type transport system permease protein